MVNVWDVNDPKIDARMRNKSYVVSWNGRINRKIMPGR